jgi:hypothetical protein
LARPLKDLWAINMAFLAATFELEDSHKSPVPELGDYARVARYKGLDSSLSTEDHRAYCAFALLEDYAPRSRGLLDLSKLPEAHKAAQRRKWIYNQLASNGYREARDMQKNNTSLQVKLCKAAKCAPERVRAAHVTANAKQVSHLVTAARWNTQVRLTFNALPFDRRRVQARMTVVERPRMEGGPTLPC